MKVAVAVALVVTFFEVSAFAKKLWAGLLAVTRMLSFVT
jgi:hypothetical protein